MQQRDTLTPLDARNSLLLDRPKSESAFESFSITKTGSALQTSAVPPPLPRNQSPDPLYPGADLEKGSGPSLFAPRAADGIAYRPITPATPLPLSVENSSRDNLVQSAAPVGGMTATRQPTLPNLISDYRGASGLRPQQQQPGAGYGGYGGYNYPSTYGRPPPSRGGY